MSSEAMPHGALPEPMSELAAEPQCGATAARRARRRKTFAIVGVIAVLVVGGGLLYFEPWTLFIDKKVDEALPGMPSTPVATAGPSSIASAIASAAATGQPVIVSMTEFISNAHSTSGKVLVVALADGSVVMRFEDLESDNGPDLRVVLSTSTLNSGGDYGGRLILEHLKGNIGSQNYTIGTDVDLGVYRSVVIWCERFGVAFGSAAIDVTA